MSSSRTSATKSALEAGPCAGYAPSLGSTHVQGIMMAGNSGDMKAHSETYLKVIGMLKWGTVACALIGALVITLIAT